MCKLNTFDFQCYVVKTMLNEGDSTESYLHG